MEAVEKSVRNQKKFSRRCADPLQSKGLLSPTANPSLFKYRVHPIHHIIARRHSFIC